MNIVVGSAALIVAGKTDDMRSGVAAAARSLDTGAAMSALETLKHETT